MQKKNLVALVAIVVVIAAVFAVSTLVNKPSAQTADPAAPVLTESVNTPTPAPTETTAETSEPTQAPAETSASPTPVVATETEEPLAYLVVTVGNMVYQPVPLTHETDYTLKQEATGAENKIHVTREGVTMSDSTCDGQDCVKQGTVTLENKDSRVLGNMIICLPNQVTLELYTPEELQAYLRTLGSDTGAAQ